jgi:hypothetical protein
MTKTTKTAKTAAKLAKPLTLDGKVVLPAGRAPVTALDKRIAKVRAAAKRADDAKAKAPTLAKLTKNAAKATGPSIVPPLAAAKLSPIAEGFMDALKLGGAIPAGKPASKVAKAGKAPAATTKPAPAAKPAKASETAGNGDAKAPTGAKGKIIAMIDASKAGVSAAEVCKALGWVRAGATIGRAIKLAPFKVAKVRDADGVLRYSREG